MSRIRFHAAAWSVIAAAWACPAHVRAATAAGPDATLFEQGISAWMGVVAVLAGDGGERHPGGEAAHHGRGDHGERRGGDGRRGEHPHRDEPAAATERPGGPDASAGHQSGGDCEHCRASREGRGHAEADAGPPQSQRGGRGPRSGMHGPRGRVHGARPAPGGTADGPWPGPRGSLAEIVDRLDRIERKLDAVPRMGSPWSPRRPSGFESHGGPDDARRGMGPRRPVRPDARRADAAGRDWRTAGSPAAGSSRDAMPEAARAMMRTMMEEGRRRMAEARERMEAARRTIQEMEERIRALEADVARLKAAR